MLNGNFEARLGWSTLTDTSLSYCVQQPFEGTWAMCLGIEPGGTNTYRYNSVEQTIDLPSASNVSLSFWYYPISTDTGQDRQYVLLIDPSGSYTPLVWVLSNGQTWLHKETDLSAYAGQTVTLRFGVYNDGKDGVTALRLDQVSLQACTTAQGSAQLWLPLLAKGFSTETLQVATLPTLSIDEYVPQRSVGLTSLASPIRAADAVRIDALTVDTLHRRVISASGTQVTVRDAATGVELLARQLPGRVARLVLSGESGDVLALLPDQGELILLSTDGNTQAVANELGQPTNAVEGDGTVYVADSAGQRIVMLDNASYAVLAARELAAEPYALAFDQAANRLYVGLMGTGQVLALDADTLETVGEVTLEGLGLPQDLALDATANKLYVAHALSPKYGALSVIDTTSMTLLTTLWGNAEQPLLGSDTVRVDATHQAVYLSQYDGCLVLDSSDLSVLETVELAPELLSALASDSLEGTLYLAGAGGQLWTWRTTTP